MTGEQSVAGARAAARDALGGNLRDLVRWMRIPSVSSDPARVHDVRLAADWLAAALERVERGRVVIIDYTSSTPALAGRPWSEWVRTYRAHSAGGSPWSELGSQDITCEVDEHQLALVRTPDANVTQATFLEANGLAELVAEGRRVWSERAHIGDVTALRARSRVAESEALIDPDGLGAFRVLEWVVS